MSCVLSLLILLPTHQSFSIYLSCLPNCSPAFTSDYNYVDDDDDDDDVDVDVDVDDVDVDDDDDDDINDNYDGRNGV